MISVWLRPQILNFENWGPLGKVTKGHQGQLMVKNTLKVDIGLRVSQPNLKRAGNGLRGHGEIQALVWLALFLTSLWPLNTVTCIHFLGVSCLKKSFKKYYIWAKKNYKTKISPKRKWVGCRFNFPPPFFYFWWPKNKWNNIKRYICNFLESIQTLWTVDTWLFWGVLSFFCVFQTCELKIKLKVELKAK